MNKKIVIVSIFLVIILVLVTYSSAIGIKSKESLTLQCCDSPLFKIRINNAINSNTAELKSSYIGKGENTLGFFQMRLFIEKINKYLISQKPCPTIDPNSCGTSSCPTNPPCTVSPTDGTCCFITSQTGCAPCGPTDNGPFCGFTENGPICDINLFNDELAFKLIH